MGQRGDKRNLTFSLSMDAKTALRMEVAYEWSLENEENKLLVLRA